MQSTSDSSEVAIKIDSLTKLFKLPHEKNSSIKSVVLNIYRKRRGYEMQLALDNISFEIKKGEFFGIVGRNGSGKSTLLKLLAGIYTPTKGSVDVNGLLTPFIELGVGFNPELTGRENVFLNGALLGFTRKQMLGMYKDIVAFAELERFMDQKLKNYSTGMQVRLAFSIAIQVQSDILLIDEVLAVGDLDFQNKCYRYFSDLKKRRQTMVFVTHDMAAVRRFCSRGALLNDGKLIAVNTADKIAGLYEKYNLVAAESRLRLDNKKHVDTVNENLGTQEAVINSVETFSASSRRVQNTFSADEKIGVRIVFEAKTEIDSPSIGFIFQNQENLTVFATNNKIKHVVTKTIKPGDKLTLETVVENVFTDGEYTITCAIESEDFLLMYDRAEYIHRFMVGGHPLPHATVHPEHTFEVSYSEKKNKE